MPDLDVSFVDVDGSGAADYSSNQYAVQLQGRAAVDGSGAQFSGAGDFATVANFAYADDDSFTVSLWLTKQSCDSTAAEVLFSHSRESSDTDMRQRSNPNINIQLLCDVHGEGRSHFDVSSVDGTVIRYNLVDMQGTWATFDYPLPIRFRCATLYPAALLRPSAVRLCAQEVPPPAASNAHCMLCRAVISGRCGPTSCWSSPGGSCARSTTASRCQTPTTASPCPSFRPPKETPTGLGTWHTLVPAVWDVKGRHPRQ